MNHLFMVEGCDVIAAKDEAEAIEAWRRYMREVIGEQPEDIEPDPAVSTYADDKPFTIHFDGAPDGESQQTRPASEWANEQPEARFIASTEW